MASHILDLVPHHATLEGWTWTWRSLAGTFVLGSNKRLQHYDLVVIRTSQDLASTHNRSNPTNTATCCCALSKMHRRQGRQMGARPGSSVVSVVRESAEIGSSTRVTSWKEPSGWRWSGAKVTARWSTLEWCRGDSQVVNAGVAPR